MIKYNNIYNIEVPLQEKPTGETKLLTNILNRQQITHQVSNYFINSWGRHNKYFLTGNSMAFAGIPNAKDRADIIAYLAAQKW